MKKKVPSKKRLWLLFFLLCIEFLLMSGFTAKTSIYDTNYVKAYSRWYNEPSGQNETAFIKAKKRANMRRNVVNGVLLVGVAINSLMIIKIGKNLWYQSERNP